MILLLSGLLPVSAPGLRIGFRSLADIDDEVQRWLKKTYEMDA